MTRLEEIGVRDVLARNEHVLAEKYDRLLSNGENCRLCRRRGGGTTEPHADDCPGVALLADTRAAIAVLTGSVTP